MATVFSVVAVRAKASNGSLVSFEAYGSLPRLAQSGYGAVFYPWKTLIPTDLCTFYPLPLRVDWRAGPYAPANAAASLATLAAVAIRKPHPGVSATWAAYLLMIAPNLGAIRVGDQVTADRYGYFATMPFYVLLAGGLARLCRRPARRMATWVVGIGLIALLSILSRRQSETWHDSESLARQAMVAGGADSPIIQTSFGYALERHGNHTGAEAHYREALYLNPGYALARTSLARLFLETGRTEAAIEEFIHVIRLRPDHAEAHYNLGAAFGRVGRIDEALAEFREALRIQPDFLPARESLWRLSGADRRSHGG